VEIDEYNEEEMAIAMSDVELPIERVTLDGVELGAEIADVDTRRPAGMVISVRLSAEEARQLQDVARRASKSLTAIARESLRATIAGGAPQPVRKG